MLETNEARLIKLLISKKLHQVRKDAENTITQSMQLGGRRELAKVAMHMQEQEFCKKWKVTANDTAASKPSSSSGSSRKRKRKEDLQNQSTDTTNGNIDPALLLKWGKYMKKYLDRCATSHKGWRVVGTSGSVP